MQPVIEVKKLSPAALLPRREHPTDSGADLFTPAAVALEPGATVKIPTGIAVCLPDGTSGIVWGKSSLEAKGLKIMAGLIDSSYRGEIIVCMHNLSARRFEFERGQKIAQLVVLPTVYPAFTETGCLPETKRGAGGFGSTGCR
ncbi:MAG: dUTP diphosphatase [Elusimicrobiaceae bacterium]|nr:dUTP diphosphatase [Elusimicrobiaceae bacterium]